MLNVVIEKIILMTAKVSQLVSKQSTLHLLYKKRSSSPSTKSFLILGHILVLKVSLKLPHLAT